MSRRLAKLMDFYYKGKEKGLFKTRKIKDIAHSFNLPKRNAMKYIKKMAEDKIGRISVSVNNEKLGIITALLFVKTSKQAHNKQFFNRALKFSFVELVTQVIGGEATHIITIKAPTLSLIGETVEKIRGEFLGDHSKDETKRWIEWTTTRIVYEYALDQHFPYFNVDKKEKDKTVKIDHKDWSLLALLIRNSLTPLKELGKKLNLQAPTVLRRIKMLEKKGAINGYYFESLWADIPYKIQPLLSYMFIRYRGAIPSINNFIKTVSSLKNIYIGDIYFLHGEEDLSMLFTIRSVTEFQRFLNSKVINSENISQINTYSVIKFSYRTVLHDFAEWAKEQEELKQV